MKKLHHVPRHFTIACNQTCLQGKMHNFLTDYNPNKLTSSPNSSKELNTAAVLYIEQFSSALPSLILIEVHIAAAGVRL